MATHYQIGVTAAEDGTFSYAPDPKDLKLLTGDSINFSSNQGMVVIQFEPPELFSAKSCGTGTDDVRINGAGEFIARCSLTLPPENPSKKGRTLGWPEDPTAGASGVVDTGKGKGP